MDELLRQIFLACGQYWRVIAIAIVMPELLKKDEGVEKAIDEFNPKNTHGGAGFADNAALRKAGLFKNKGIPIGYSQGGRALHYSGKSHLLTICKARGGKGVSLLLPALGSWKGSAVVIDPKGENACVSAHFRQRFGKVFVLNPFGMWPDHLRGLREARFNPLSVLDSASPSFHAMAEKIGAVLIVEEEHNEGRHWTAAARLLVSGLIAALVRHGPKDKRNLVEVLSILSSGDGLFTFCREAMGSNDPDIIRKLQRFALPEDKQPSREMEDVIATAVT
jgi:type IV secretion system protein VirD4